MRQTLTRFILVLAILIVSFSSMFFQFNAMHQAKGTLWNRRHQEKDTRSQIWALAENRESSERSSVEVPPLNPSTEKLQIPKVFVYELPAEFNTDALADLRARKTANANMWIPELEAHLHQLYLTAPNRVTNPHEAELFFIPVYPSIWLSGRAAALEFRELARQRVLDAITFVKSNHPWWGRFAGADHIVPFCHDQGACMDYRSERVGETRLSKELMSELQNVIHLSVNGDKKLACFNADRDVVIPPMTAPALYSFQGGRTRPPDSYFAYFRGQLSLEVQGKPWIAIRILYGNVSQQRQPPALHGTLVESEPETPLASARRVCCREREGPLANISGTCESELRRSRIYSNGVRQRLRDAFWQTPHSRPYRPDWFRRGLPSIIADNASDAYVEELRASQFCLAPVGHATWTLRMFEAVVLGCVPVMLADDTVFPFEHFFPPSSYGVVVYERDVHRLPFLLQSLASSGLEAKRRVLREMWHAFAWIQGRAGGATEAAFAGSDAFHYALRELGRKWERLAPILREARSRSGPPSVAFAAFHGTGAWPDRSGRYIPRQPFLKGVVAGVEANVTLVTHLRGAQQLLLPRLCAAWDGAISAAVWVEEGGVAAEAQHVRECGGRLNLSHVPARGRRRYPDNMLRNAALRRVETLFAFLLDIELVPSMNLRAKFLASWAAGDFPPHGSVAVVVPAFEFTRAAWRLDLDTPQWRSVLLGMLLNRLAREFEKPRHPTSQYYSNAVLWSANDTAPYEVAYAFGYEPSLILRRPFLPFDERFAGMGRASKMSHAFELAAMRYRFFVLRRGFAFYRPALTPNAKTQPEAREEWKRPWYCWRSFAADLAQHYGSVKMASLPKEGCWVSRLVYPRLHADARAACAEAA